MSEIVHRGTDRVISGGTTDFVEVPYASASVSRTITLTPTATGSFLVGPNVLATQAALEGVLKPSDAVARVTQAALETVLEPTTSLSGLVTQSGIEVVGDRPRGAGGVTQTGLDAIRAIPAANTNAAITQAGVDAIRAIPSSATNAVLTQTGIEVVRLISHNRPRFNAVVL